MRARASAQAARRSSGRNGARVAAAARRAGPVSSGATAASSRGSRSPSTQTRPTASVSRSEPRRGRARPPGHGAAGRGAREHEQREMRHVQIARQRAGAGLVGELAAERPGQVRVRLGGEREPRRPERERRGHQRRDEELQHGHHGRAAHASASTYRSWRRHMGDDVPPLALGMLAAEGVQRPVHDQADQLLADRDAAGPRLALGHPGADVHVADRAARRRRPGRSSGRRSAGRAPCARR